ncbi:hypothetical protein [Clostridium sp. D53t1_180928_C8]|nr:hypothetical protein [Clostridium sp. D53t1_180928_C8]
MSGKLRKLSIFTLGGMITTMLLTSNAAAATATVELYTHQSS